jgi:hypothetical protein
LTYTIPSRAILFLLLCSAAVVPVRSQSADSASVWLGDDWYFTVPGPFLPDLATFTPRLIRAEVRLKQFIRSEQFFLLRKRYDDTLAVDAIYDRAMLLTEGNIRDALFIATVAVMDHRQLGLKLPLLGSVYLPLTTESDSLFRLRRTHLPKKILDDNSRAADKDKLQHFFGSAFLAYATNSQRFAATVGDLFELGEDAFVLGGRSDDRDQLANAKGRRFGRGLLKDPDLLPSDILWEER